MIFLWWNQLESHKAQTHTLQSAWWLVRCYPLWCVCVCVWDGSAVYLRALFLLLCSSRRIECVWDLNWSKRLESDVCCTETHLCVYWLHWSRWSCIYSYVGLSLFVIEHCFVGKMWKIILYICLTSSLWSSALLVLIVLSEVDLVKMCDDKVAGCFTGSFQINNPVDHSVSVRGLQWHAQSHTHTKWSSPTLACSRAPGAPLYIAPHTLLPLFLVLVWHPHTLYHIYHTVYTCANPSLSVCQTFLFISHGFHFHKYDIFRLSPSSFLPLCNCSPSPSSFIRLYLAPSVRFPKTPAWIWLYCIPWHPFTHLCPFFPTELCYLDIVLRL